MVESGTNGSYRVMVLFIGRTKSMSIRRHKNETTNSSSQFLLWDSALITEEASGNGKCTPSFSNIKSRGNVLFNRQPFTVEK